MLLDPQGRPMAGDHWSKGSDYIDALSARMAAHGMMDHALPVGLLA